MSLNYNMIMNEELNVTAMESVRNPEGLIEGCVIVEFLRHITQCDKPKTAFIHPNYMANFYAPNENIFEQIKENSSAYPAVDFVVGPSDFEILLVPFHVRQRDEWRGGEHWMLGIFDKENGGGRQLLVLYDPKPKRVSNKLILEEEHRIILRHILKTVMSGQVLKGSIMLPRSRYNCQEKDDFTSCGIYVCYYAKEYLRIRSIKFVPDLDIQVVRRSITQVMEAIYLNQHSIENAYISNDNRTPKLPLNSNIKSVNGHNEAEPSHKKYRSSQCIDYNDQINNEEKDRKELEYRRKFIRRSMETNEERERRLEDNRLRMFCHRNMETAEQRQERLEDNRLRMFCHRNMETEEQRQHRLQKNRLWMAKHRNIETKQDRNQRLEKDRNRKVTFRDNKNKKENGRLYKAAMNPSEVIISRFGKFDIDCIYCGAVHFPEERTGGQHNRNSFGDCCKHGRINCSSKEYPSGIPMDENFPEELKQIFLKMHPSTKDFRFHDRIRNLNSSFALASLCIENNRTPSNGIYAFTVSGQVYHKLNLAVHPSKDTEGNLERPVYGQLYFLDSEESVEHRLNHPANLTQGQQHQALNREVVKLLEKIIREHNVFAQSFELMREVEEHVNEQAISIGIEPLKVNLLFTTDNKSEIRRSNIPVANEISAVMILNPDGSIPENSVVVHPRVSIPQKQLIPNMQPSWLEKNEITIHQKGKEIKILSNMDPRIEPFIYPLFFPSGMLGWHDGLTYSAKNGIEKRLTRLMFVRYRIAFRRCYATQEIVENPISNIVANSFNKTFPKVVKFNPLHFGEKLFQQYCVDMYIRIERDRIQWIKDNQKKIKADNYTSVNLFLEKLEKKEEANVECKIILPSTFPGSPRYYSECYEDAMALVRRYGTPDLFITMTCNPKWPEIQEALFHKLSITTSIQQYANMRPDIIARIFKLKSDQLINDIFKDKVFGKTVAYVSVIEFQKRGLPHLHLLVILHHDDKLRTPEQVDDYISAEIPDRNKDPDLYKIVEQNMIHDPCGFSNPNANCMDIKTGKCRWNYPKDYQEQTLLPENEQPLYRRRKNDIGNYSVYRKDKNNESIRMDNRNVAPYNAWLLKRYNCHINVEYVGGVKAVKYLYKYIYKGHDIAQVKVVSDNKSIIYDECEKHIEGRYVSSYEACWRIFEYELQRKSHSVQRLDVHLKDKYGPQHENLPEDLVDIGQKGSTLEAWFKLNQTIKEKEKKHAVLHEIKSKGSRKLTTGEEKELLEKVEYNFYWEVPEFYTWYGNNSEWRPKKRTGLKIGRMYSVSPLQPDRYHLRLLLLHVKGATCYEDLLTFNGIEHISYKNACLARGLAYDDKQWIDGLKEHCLFKMPRAMRTFFALILMYGEPANPKGLWDEFKYDLSEDFIREAQLNNDMIENAVNKAYGIIAKTLETEAPEGRHFKYWVQTYNMDPVDYFYDEEDLKYKIPSVEVKEKSEDFYQKLNEEQRQAADAILHAVKKEEFTERCFFIDGPGGTGKSFLFKTLYFILISENKQVLNMATTGIASTLLSGGMTAHKTFGLDVPLRSDSESRIKVGSSKAKYLKKIDVFFLDESPMLPRYGMENIDMKLRELRNNYNVPFGGAVMVFGGDFRQCLPVQPRANQSELRSLSIKQSSIWMYFRIFHLTKNMRIDDIEVDFKRWTLQIGDGKLNVNEFDEIVIPDNNICTGDLVEEVFGICLSSQKYNDMQKRAILCPFNREVAKHNNQIISRLPDEYSTYKSFDSVKEETEDGLHLSDEFLNSLESPELPPHELKVKKNTIIMLLRNMKVNEGLCNGTRIVINELSDNVIRGKIITEGAHYGRDVCIPRITLDSSKGFGFTLSRHQFPVKPAFAITIHKSQGQTFDVIGVDLTRDVFSHGQLYVAFSRVRSQSGLKVLLCNKIKTKNIVDKVILRER